MSFGNLSGSAARLMSGKITKIAAVNAQQTEADRIVFITSEKLKTDTED